MYLGTKLFHCHILWKWIPFYDDSKICMKIQTLLFFEGGSRRDEFWLRLWFCCNGGWFSWVVVEFVGNPSRCRFRTFEVLLAFPDTASVSHFSGWDKTLSPFELDDDEFDKQDISVSIEYSIPLELDNESGDTEEDSKKLLAKIGN